ncbi:MAG: outer membrane protein assembly factor BamD [Acidobacteriota bacterium]
MIQPSFDKRKTRVALGLGVILGLILGLGTPDTVRAQEGTGSSTEDGGSNALRVQSKKLTRKEKKQQKALEREQEKARKERNKLEKESSRDQKKWEKMGLASQTAEQWYATALARYKTGKYLPAREILLPLEDSPRALDIQEKVKLLIADTYYYQGGSLNLTEALARYRSFLTFFPGSEHAEYARFQLGNCYYKQLGPADRDQSFTKSAIAEYEKLLVSNPDSPYAESAAERIVEARALAARHEFQVGKFYWDWGNYEAASGRLMRLLLERPETPDREQALYLTAQCLYELGRPDEAEAWAARLRTDHPDSSWAAKLKPRDPVQAMEQVEKRHLKREKRADRTHRRTRARQAKRTRQIRKDSGLPKRVPTDPVAVAAWHEEAVDKSERESSKSLAKTERKDAKLAEKMRREEEKEQAERQAKLEREMKKAEKQAAKETSAAPASEVASTDSAKSDKAAKKEAERLEKQRKKMEQAEEEERQEAARQEAREQARRDKEAAKAEKKRLEEEKKAQKQAEKEAKKQGGGQ